MEQFKPSFKPEYKLIEYRFNHDRKRFEIEKMPLGFTKLPEWLKVETIHETQTVNAEFIIHGGIKNKRYRFFTGIRKTETENVFFGDDGYHKFEKKSFILFEFKEGNTVLNVYHFNQFTPPKPLRETFFTLLTK